jgi:hypothetical protein
MTSEFTQVLTRPSADVPWFIDTLPESHLNYIRDNYVATGKLTGSTTRLDDLTLMQTFIFTTLADQEEFLNDPYIAEKAIQRTAYNEANGIIQVS